MDDRDERSPTGDTLPRLRRRFQRRAPGLLRPVLQQALLAGRDGRRRGLCVRIRRRLRLLRRRVRVARKQLASQAWRSATELRPKHPLYFIK